MSTPPNPTITAPPPPPSMTQPTGGERALGAIGGALAGGAGLDFSQTALGKHIAQNQAARLDEAKFHYQNIQKVASALGTGVDPNTGRPLTPQQEQQYNNWYNMEWQAFEKSAGASKEAKQHLGMARKMVDMVIQHGRQQAQQQKPQTATPSPPPGMMAQPPAAGSPTANAQVEAARIQEQNIAAQNRIKEIQAEGAAKLAEEQGKPTPPPKPLAPPRVVSHFTDDKGNHVSVFSDGSTKVEGKEQSKPTKPSAPPKSPKAGTDPQKAIDVAQREYDVELDKYNKWHSDNSMMSRWKENPYKQSLADKADKLAKAKAAASSGKAPTVIRFDAQGNRIGGS